MIGPVPLVLSFPDGRLTWAGFIRLMAIDNGLRGKPENYERAQELAIENSRDEADGLRLVEIAAEYTRHESAGCRFLSLDYMFYEKPWEGEGCPAVE